MNEIKNLFEALNKRQPYSTIAEQAGVSRNTLLSVRTDPEKSSLRILRKVALAMGYNLVLTFQKIEKETVNERQKEQPNDQL
jgi:transcriptional regulator with XRE-family HTH domain